MPRVRFLNEMINVEVPQGTTLREVAIQQGVELYRGMWTHINCLGNGVCGRCRVWIVSPVDTVSHRSLREHAHRVQGKTRLACQVRITGDVEIRTRPVGAVVVAGGPVGASYREEAERRLREAREAERDAERKEAEKKARAAAEAKAAAETKPADTAAPKATEAKPPDAGPPKATEPKPAATEPKPS